MSIYSNLAPLHIIAGPLEIWTAPVATAFPEVDEDPGGSWTKVGASGADDYAEDGVSVSHPQSISLWRGLGSEGPRKAFRSEGGVIVRVDVADLTAEAFKLALNGNTITTTSASSGVPGTKKIGLSRGLEVAQYAVLVRGASPYGDDFKRQYEIPVAVVTSTQEVKPTKTDPGMLTIEFTALEDPSASSAAEKLGRLVCQTAVASE